jgi:hypothetical protein
MAKSLKDIKLTSKKNLSAEEQEKAFLKLQMTADTSHTKAADIVEADDKDVVRISIDIPKPLYEKVKKESKLRGYSMRAFFVQRGWEYFEKIEK